MIRIPSPLAPPTVVPIVPTARHTCPSRPARLHELCRDCKVGAQSHAGAVHGGFSRPPVGDCPRHRWPGPSMVTSGAVWPRPMIVLWLMVTEVEPVVATSRSGLFASCGLCFARPRALEYMWSCAVPPREPWCSVATEVRGPASAPRFSPSQVVLIGGVTDSDAVASSEPCPWRRPRAWCSHSPGRCWARR